MKIKKKSTNSSFRASQNTLFKVLSPFSLSLSLSLSLPLSLSLVCRHIVRKDIDTIALGFDFLQFWILLDLEK